MSDKTEEATPKKLRKAQEEGDSPISAFASQAIAFLCAVAVAPAVITALATRTTGDLRAAIAHAGDVSPRIAFEPLPACRQSSTRNRPTTRSFSRSMTGIPTTSVEPRQSNSRPSVTRP